MTIFEINIFWINIAPTYYWLMYAISFLIWYYFLVKFSKLQKKHLDDFFVYMVIWVILWGRIGYVLFYNFEYYLNNLVDIFKVWEWWMSFHWWLFWVIVASFIFWKIKNIKFFTITDSLALVAPIWLFFGRIWNYINQELLWFSWYNGLFATYVDWVWYFPSSLLEAFLEWFLLFLVLNFIYFKNKDKLNSWILSWVFLIWYSVSRIFVELFFRQPDEQLWYIFSNISMWVILTFPMLIIWIILLIKSIKNDK